MAHNLEIKNGVASLMLVKEPAWHGLGTIVKEAATQEQVLQLAGLNYKVDLVTPQFQYDGGIIKDLNNFAIMRQDTGAVFGYVKDRYNIIQNEEAFLFFDNFIEKTEAVYHTAGVLKSGEISWILAKLPEHISVNDDVIEMYVLVVMHHDGKHAMQMMFTPVRVVCNNTLDAATGTAQNIVAVRHNSNYVSNINEAVRLMGIKNNYVAEINEVFEELATVKVSGKVAEQFFNQLIVGKKNIEGIEISTQKQNMINNMLEYYKSHPTQQNIKGTAWGLYNAVSGYYNNVKEVSDVEKRFTKTLISGDAKTMNAQAFHMAMMLS